jgi:predicted RND superfamily exporter protein
VYPIFQFDPRHARPILLLVTVLTVLSIVQLVDLETGTSRIDVDASADRLLPEEDESRKFYDHVRRLFGSDEIVLVALVTDDVFTRENLARVERMTRRIQELNGVHHVLSLANAVNVRGVEDGLEIAPFLSGVPEDPAELERVRNEVLSNPIYAGSLVSRDARTTALLVYFMDMSNREYLESGLDERIVELAQEESGDADVWITGGPHIRVESARILLREVGTIPLLILMALGGVLALGFRTVRGVVIPLVTIAVAVSWTMALVVWMGYALNGVTVLVPALLTTLGLSYSVHVVSAYYEEVREEPGADDGTVVVRALRRVALPVSLTGLTTAAGFASFALSPLGAVREFGLFSVIGVVCTVVAALTLTPALLAQLGIPKRLRAPLAGGASERFFDRMAARIGRFSHSHRMAIFVGALLVFLVALGGTTRMRIGTEQITKFRADSPVRIHFEAVNAHLEGANPFYVILETDYPEGFKEPVNLRELEVLQTWLEEQPEIGGSTSLVDYLKLINRGFNENDPEFLTIPETKRIVSQLFFFGGSEELNRFVDSRFQTASIQLRARVVDSDNVAALIDRIERRLEALPEHLEATVTGTAVVFNRALDEIILGQAASVGAALLIIYGILAAMFVSLRIGLIALIPNVLPIAVYFGALGLTGVSLNPGTSLIAPMVLGIAVDDTIHYFARFNRDAKLLGSEEQATVSALKAVGRPVTYTSLALCVGFLMLVASEFRTQGQLGMLAAFALGFAWLTDFLLTPALCSHLRIATFWDLLTLDLGHEPHHSIPLFEGLSAPQARIVALMATVLEIPPGEYLMHAGEQGESLFVVIDGTLRATVPGEKGPVEVAIHKRGEVVGDVGLFYEKQRADVEVLECARLLRLTQSSVDRLSHRYPRIATVVFRNLNEILAHRLAQLSLQTPTR